jgi:Arc/MetJ-type ribon-helix-helix transcriptional regulator
MRQAGKEASASLLAVASAVQLDAFSKVSDMINKMIADIKQESDDETEHKAYCEAELHTNEMATTDNDNLLKDLQAQVADLSSQIDTFTDEIAELKASITEMYIQMQRSNENREVENRQFQTTVADQRATQVILLKALDRLNVFYDQQALLQAKPKPSLIQSHGKHKQAPPPGLSEYKSNDGAGSVLTMLKEIIQDAKNMEKTAIKDEQDANDGYVAFVQQTYEAVAAAQSSIVDKQEAKAESEIAKIGKVEDLKGAEAEAKTLNNVLAQLHSSCDFVMENFFLRQEARDNEVSSLQETLAALKTDEAS